jgi:hypothetical protein
MMERRGDITNNLLDSEIFIQTLEKSLSKDQLNAAPFIIEKASPKTVNELLANGHISEGVASMILNPPKELKAGVTKIKRYFEDGHNFLKDHWDNASWVDNYVTHLWDTGILNKTKQAKSIPFTKKNPFLQKRSVPTLAEGIQSGLTPRTLNIAEMLRVYDAYKIKTAFNSKMAKGLTKLKTEDGTPAVLRIDSKKGEGYIKLDHPAMNRAIAIGRYKGKGPKPDVLVLSKIPVKVHPEVYPLLKNIFDAPYSGKAAGALSKLNAFTKKSILSLSLFHHLALTEAAFGNGIGLKAMKMWNPFEMYRQMKKGDWYAIRNQPLVKDAIAHGVNIDPLPDYHVNTVHKALKDLEFRARNIPGAKQATKGMRKVNEVWDTALWNYYHTNLKIMAYEKLVGDRMAGKGWKAPESLKEIKQMKQQTAEFVNDSFGGQNWELSEMFGSPKMQQAMGWMLLSPDWTVSTLKQAFAPLRKGAHTKTHGIAFWIRSAAYYNIVSQTLNYHNSKKMYGEGRFTWENPPDKNLDILIGRNEDGTEKYLKIGKQFREPIEWASKPARKFGAKLSPPLRELLRQLTGHDPGSFFPTKFAKSEDSVDSVKERLKSIAMTPIPLSIRPFLENRTTPFLLSIPTSKGMTMHSGIKAMKQAVKKKDRKLMRKLFVHALQNNLNAEKMVELANRGVVDKVRFDNKKIAKQIIQEMQQIKTPEGRGDLIDYYRKKGILTPGVQLQYDKLVAELEEIRKQQQDYGVTINQ